MISNDEIVVHFRILFQHQHRRCEESFIIWPKLAEYRKYIYKLHQMRYTSILMSDPLLL